MIALTTGPRWILDQRSYKRGGGKRVIFFVAGLEVYEGGFGLHVRGNKNKEKK